MRARLRSVVVLEADDRGVLAFGALERGAGPREPAARLGEIAGALRGGRRVELRLRAARDARRVRPATRGDEETQREAEGGAKRAKTRAHALPGATADPSVGRYNEPRIAIDGPWKTSNDPKSVRSAWPAGVFASRVTIV